MTARGMDDPSIMDVRDVANALRADLVGGLTRQDAAVRLAEDGPNELRAILPLPAWRRLAAHFQDPLIYLLLAAIVIALVAWVVDGMVRMADRRGRHRDDRRAQRLSWFHPGGPGRTSGGRTGAHDRGDIRRHT